MPVEPRTVALRSMYFAFLLVGATGPPVLAGVPAADPKTPPPASVLPERTLAACFVEDIAATAERFRETGVYKLWKEPEVQAFFKPLTEGLDAMHRKAEEMGGFSFADVLGSLEGQAAFAFVGVKPTEGGGLLPEFAFAAGVADRDAVARLIARAARAAEEAGGPAMNTWRFGPVTIGRMAEERGIIEIGYVLTRDALYVTLGPRGELMSEIASAAWGAPKGKTLAEGEDFRHALDEAGAGRDLFSYLAYAKASGLFFDILEREEGARNADVARRVHEALGLGGVRSVSLAERIDPPGFRTQVYLHAPAPRTGVFELLSEEPVRRELLELAPAGSSFLVSCRLRLDRLLPLVRRVAKIAWPGADERIGEGLPALSEATGVDLQRDVFEGLGGEAMLFNAPVGATGLVDPVARAGGLTLVARAAKPEAFGPFYEKVVEIVTGLAIVGGTEIVEETTPEGAVLRYVSFRLGTTPAVAYFENHLVAGVTKQAVARVCASLAKDEVEGSFASSAEYEKALARLSAGRAGAGVAPGFLLGYLATLTEEDLAQPLDLAPIWAPRAKGRLMRAASRRGVPEEIREIVRATNLAEPPSAETIVRHSTSQIAAGWGERDGVGLTAWTSTGVITPSVASAAVGAAVAAPVIERAKENAERRRCADNLREVGLALARYAKEHGDEFPPRLDDLVPKYLGGPAFIQCPTTAKKYAYISGLRGSDRPSMVVAYEPPEGHRGGVNTLYVRGNVAWRRDIKWVERRVEHQTRQLRAQGRRTKVEGGLDVPVPAEEEEEFF